MNKRIKELSKQAGSVASATYATAPDAIWLREYNKKFAELIVGECLDVVAMRLYLGPEEICRQECKALAADIKEHFGVE